MPTIKDYLVQWNGGIERGAQTKLSNEIRAAEATISRWISGELRPSELKIQKLASAFKVSIDEIKSALKLSEQRREFGGRMEAIKNSNIRNLRDDIKRQKNIWVEFTPDELAFFKNILNKINREGLPLSRIPRVATVRRIFRGGRGEIASGQ